MSDFMNANLFTARNFNPSVNSNTKQLMELRENLIGVSKDKDRGIFAIIKSLDTNNSKKIDANEVALSELLGLGKNKLDKLFAKFNISNFNGSAGVLKEGNACCAGGNIVEDYFRPIIDKCNKTYAQDLKEGEIAGLVTPNYIEGMYKTIIAEKLNSGVEIVYQDANRITFSDGSSLYLENVLEKNKHETVATSNMKTQIKDILAEGHKIRKVDLESNKIEFSNGEVIKIDKQANVNLIKELAFLQMKKDAGVNIVNMDQKSGNIEFSDGTSFSIKKDKNAIDTEIPFRICYQTIKNDKEVSAILEVTPIMESKATKITHVSIIQSRASLSFETPVIGYEYSEDLWNSPFGPFFEIHEPLGVITNEDFSSESASISKYSSSDDKSVILATNNKISNFSQSYWNLKE